jgi:hypothetical protein
MVMYKTKNTLSTLTRCPKCGGRVFLEKDHFGWYAYCILCGHNVNLKEDGTEAVAINYDTDGG